jgi:SAM-dependent methyltransferase
MARVLDLGCGTGNIPRALKLAPEDEIVGLDISEQRIAIARQCYPERRFECGRGESLPFPDGSFDCVVSSVAVPYMNIPLVLAEVRRVLAPGGQLLFSLHPLRFTLQEFRNCRTLRSVIFRLCVVLNGLWFYLAGKTFGFGNNCESFQTERGMRIALRRAGFVNIVFLRPEGRLLVQAHGPISATETPRLFLHWPATAS